MILAILFANSLAAAEWSATVGTGPFVFGNLAERTSTVTNGEQTTKVESSLSAATRAGITGELERRFNERLSARLAATFTRSPLSVKTDSSNDDPDSDGVSLNVGDLNVTTFAALLAFRFNRGGSLRPFLAAGPAYALYNMEDSDDEGVEPLFTGTRGRWGVTAAAGVEWWLSDRFAVRAELSDVYTETPLEEGDLSRPRNGSLEIKDPHNVHTTIGATYRF